MKYLISYRQLKITPARASPGLAFVSAGGVVGARFTPQCAKFRSAAICADKKRLFPGKGILLRAKMYNGQAGGKPATDFLSN